MNYSAGESGNADGSGKMRNPNGPYGQAICSWPFKTIDN